MYRLDYYAKVNCKNLLFSQDFNYFCTTYFSKHVFSKRFVDFSTMFFFFDRKDVRYFLNVYTNQLEIVLKIILSRFYNTYKIDVSFEIKKKNTF